MYSFIGYLLEPLNYIYYLICYRIASLKSLGDKTTSLFDRKKKDVEKLAQDKAAEAQHLAEEQAKLTSDALLKTKAEAEALVASTGLTKFHSFILKH